MSPENKKILKQLHALIKNKSKYSNEDYLFKLENLREQLKHLVITKTEVVYEEINIIDVTKNIIKNSPLKS